MGRQIEPFGRSVVVGPYRLGCIRRVGGRGAADRSVGTPTATPGRSRLPRPGAKVRSSGAKAILDLLVLASSDGGRRGRRDLDPPRLHRFRQFTHELDHQQAVVQVSAHDLDVVGELEVPLEGTAGDAAIEIGMPRIPLLLPALDQKRVLARLDTELVLAEAGDGECDAILVLARLLDIVRWVAIASLGPLHRVLEHGHQPVEPNGRAEQGRKVEGRHNCTSSSSSNVSSRLKRIVHGQRRRRTPDGHPATVRYVELSDFARTWSAHAATRRTRWSSPVRRACAFAREANHRPRSGTRRVSARDIPLSCRFRTACRTARPRRSAFRASFCPPLRRRSWLPPPRSLGWSRRYE